jgi:DNA primase
VTRRYLEERGFNPNQLISEYDIMDGGNAGTYAWSVIIPIIMNGRVVSFTSRSIRTEKPDHPERTRYKMCPDSLALMPRNNLLYNVDSVSRGVIICEGPTDVWRIGRGCVATFGTKFSSGQIDLLRRIGVQRAFIMYDPEAEAVGEMLAASLKPFCSHVEVIYLDDDRDPGDLSAEEAQQIRRDLLGY